MYKSKLTKTLSLLSKRELRLFRRFLKSPYFNNSKNVLELYNYLQKLYPNFESPLLRKEIIHDKLFPGTQYNKKKIIDLMSDLTLLVNDFLINNHLKEDRQLRQKLLVKSYQKRRGLDELHEGVANRLLSDLERSKIKNLEYYNNVLNLSHDVYFHSIKTNRLSPTLRSIEVAIDNLDRFFVLAKLKYSLEIISRQRVLGKSYPILLLDEVIFIGAEFAKENKLIKVYLDLIELHRFDENSFELFQDLKDRFINNRNDFDEDDKLHILLYLINYAISNQHNDDNAFYKQELFQLYKIGLADRILLQHETISETAFINIVILASSLKEFNWCKEFIGTYSENIGKKSRENATLLGRAFLSFYMKNFEDAIVLLQRLIGDSILYKILARSLLLRCYFELSIEDKSYLKLFESYASSFEKFLTRNRSLSQNRLEGYIRYVRFTRKLLLYLIDGKGKDQRNKLIDQFENNPSVIARDWLREKIKTL